MNRKCETIIDEANRKWRVHWYRREANVYSTWDKLISFFNDSGKHATLTDAGPRTDGKGLSPNREGKRIRERFAR